MTTVPGDLAPELARAIIEHQLAACVQTSAVQSCYRWDGAIESASECLLIMKTTATRYPQLQHWLEREHPYDVPEIIALPVHAYSAAYGDWVLSNTHEK